MLKQKKGKVIKMKIKKIFLVSLIVVCLLALTGCGSKDKECKTWKKHETIDCSMFEKDGQWSHYWNCMEANEKAGTTECVEWK